MHAYNVQTAQCTHMVGAKFVFLVQFHWLVRNAPKIHQYVYTQFPPGSHKGQEDMNDFTLGGINRDDLSTSGFQSILSVSDSTGGISCKNKLRCQKIPNHDSLFCKKTTYFGITVPRYANWYVLVDWEEWVNAKSKRIVQQKDQGNLGFIYLFEPINSDHKSVLDIDYILARIHKKWKNYKQT